MATKKLDPRSADPNFSVPQADPQAVNLIIPRREVLAGTALLLMGSASGCGPVATAKPYLLRTQFMADFTAEFIGDPATIPDPAPPPKKNIWPDPNRRWPTDHQVGTDILADYATFVNVLMTVGYLSGPPPSTYAAGTLGDRIGKFLTAKNWPTQPPVPPEYQTEQPTVHLVEIAVILDRLLLAINTFNPDAPPGGGPSNWPPH
jgi:hypothetical protein